MGWAIGFDPHWNRDVGYGVPAECEFPDCTEKIDRGLGYVCGSDAYGGEHGCGLYFCGEHLWMGTEKKPVQLCYRCMEDEEPFDPKPDTREWVHWKLVDGSWGKWRAENPEEVRALLLAMKKTD